LCRLADIQSKSVLLQVVRQGDSEKMVALVDRLRKDGSTRADVRKLMAKSNAHHRGRPRHFVFKLKPRGGDFSLALEFKRSEVDRVDIIRTLESILETLRREQ
jgi:ParB family chromosome partitioning protein